MGVHFFMKRRSFLKTIIRAAIFKSNMLPGTVKTHSYFADHEFYENELSVISIAGDPGDFWDEDKGIYV